VVGVVGADAIGPEALLNADGTRELAGRVPTLVVATAVKLVPAGVFGRLGGAGFEVVPLEALAAVVIGPEVLSPTEAGRRAAQLKNDR
jgi:2-methylisocitrate lyase-like PEP mutase family enzyme